MTDAARWTALALAGILAACGGGGSGGGTPEPGDDDPLPYDSKPRACGSVNRCGLVPDGAGGTLDCGGCYAPETCGGGLSPDYCGHCDANGWCFEAPRPLGPVFQRSFPVADDDVWFTGDGGLVWQWNGVWRDRSSTVRAEPGYSDVHGPAQLWGTSSDDLWGVSRHGLWHWDGTSWSLVRTGWNLYDIRGRAADDIWATGSNGLLVHYDGTGWSVVPTGRSDTLSSISPLAADDVWFSVPYGLQVHWNGQGFTEHGLFAPAQTTGAPIASFEPWVVWQIDVKDCVYRIFYDPGGDRERFEILHTGPASNLTGHGPDDVWIRLPYSTVAHWDGATWTEHKPVDRYVDLVGGGRLSPGGDLWFTTESPFGVAVLRRR